MIQKMLIYFKLIKGENVKKMMIVLMILVFSCRLFADALPHEADFPVVSPDVMSEINKPVDRPFKLTKGSWIALGIIIIVGALAASSAYNTRTPLNR